MDTTYLSLTGPELVMLAIGDVLLTLLLLSLAWNLAWDRGRASRARQWPARRVVNHERELARSIRIGNR